MPSKHLYIDETQIREFKESDLISVGDLIYKTIDACYSGIYPPRAVQFFKQFHSHEKIIERHQRGEILIVEQDDNVLGTGSLINSDISGVFVHPQFHGRGFGGALMRELEKRAMASGCVESELSVSLPSRGFYEGLGYVILQECSIDVGEDQHLYYWQAKKLLRS